jgi:uncharacterized protein YjbI with pentapeptide repeats
VANPEHLAILKQGVKAWNRWRAEHPPTSLDLSEAHLRGADLSGADLSEVDLRGADLSGCLLRGCDLKRAQLQATILQPHWQLIEYELRGPRGYVDADIADEREEGSLIYSTGGPFLLFHRMREIDASNASFEGANLVRATIVSASFGGAGFAGAIFGGTTIDCDLSQARALEDTKLWGRLTSPPDHC